MQELHCKDSGGEGERWQGEIGCDGADILWKWK
jgi:hypothetical protein